MATEVSGWTLGELAQMLGGEIEGPSDLRVVRPVPADSEDSQGLAFAESETYLARVAAGGAGAVLAPKGSPSTGKPTIFVDRPREAFGRFLAMCARPLPLNAGIHPTAIVDPSATVAESAQIGPYAVVERGAVIGERARVYAHCYVGENCRIGDRTVLFPRVVLYQDVTVGARGILHSGVVLGADGFGFIWDGTRQVKIPQVGGVILGDDVEIGANTTIDRAMSGATSIGNDTKIDNLVQVGHNTSIGSHTVIAGMTGISGSCHVGDRVSIAGMVAIPDHIDIADDIVLAGRSAVMNDLPEKGTYFGMPARPLSEAMRNLMLYTKLPELFRRVKKLERGSEEE